MELGRGRGARCEVYGERDARGVVEVEVFARRGRGAVRLDEADGEEEGLVLDLVQRFDCPGAGSAVGEFVIINLRRLRDDGPTLATIETRDDIAQTPMGQIADAAVLRLDQLEDPTTHLKRLAKKHSTPRRLRRLAETHGDITYQPDDPDHTRALDTMRDMLQRRWGPDDGPPMFRTPHMDAFTRDTLHHLTTTGFARIATLTAGTTPVAVSTVLEVGDRQISDNAALDPDLAQFGPGHAALYHLLEHAHRTGAREVDLRAGDFPYKYKWANTTHRTRSLALTTPGIRHDAMLAARRALMSLRARRLNRLRDQPR